MVWPTGSAWPRNEAELLRENAMYRERPDACQWYVANEEKGRPADASSEAVEEGEGSSLSSPFDYRRSGDERNENVSLLMKRVPEDGMASLHDAHSERSEDRQSSEAEVHKSKSMREGLTMIDWESEADIEDSRKIHSLPVPPPGTVWIAE